MKSVSQSGEAMETDMLDLSNSGVFDESLTIVSSGKPPPDPKKNSSNGQKIFHPLEIKTERQLQQGGYVLYLPLSIFLMGISARLRGIFDQYCFAERENYHPGSCRLIHLPANCFGGKPLLLPIDMLVWMVLCFWDKEDLNYLPLYKSIPPPTEDQLDKYVR
ncbi:hypothetical protein FO519_010950, partial [Halicephalobus sp. NKZ332]